MKVYLCSLVTFLFILNFHVHAQEQENSFNKPALHFYFINGYAVAYKFKSSENSGYRVDLDFLLNEMDQDYDDDHENTFSHEAEVRVETSKSRGRSERKGFGLNLSPQYIYRIYNSGPAFIYLGGGPFVGYNYSESRDDEYYSSLTQRSHDYSSETRSYSAGIKSFIGIEGIISKVISLFAETELSAGGHWSNSKYDEASHNAPDRYSGKTKRTKKSWFYELSNVRVGVGFYF